MGAPHLLVAQGFIKQAMMAQLGVETIRGSAILKLQHLDAVLAGPETLRAAARRRRCRARAQRPRDDLDTWDFLESAISRAYAPDVG